MRMGAKKRPFYRVVVKEKRSKRDGKYLENLGTYDPLQDPAEVILNHDRIRYWISVGAKPTDTVASLIKHNPEMSADEREAMLKERAEKKAAAEKARLEAKKAEEARLAAESESQGSASDETVDDPGEISAQEPLSGSDGAEETPVAETSGEEEKPQESSE
jgi:small subunit ribosomal protein S16